MSYSTSPFNPDQKYKGQVKSELKQADDNFNILAQAFKNNDPTTGIVNHALVADSCNNCSGNSSDEYFGLEYDGNETTISSLFYWTGGTNYYIIQDTAPKYSGQTTFWYNTNNNMLYLLTREGFYFAIDWRSLPKKDLWYGIGKIKIENNQLKISNDGNNWITAYTCSYSGFTLQADDSNSNDDFKIVYLYADNNYYQYVMRPGSTNTKTRVACVSPSNWKVAIYQNTNQNTAGWIGLHLGDTDISDGQGKMTSNGSDFDTSNYSDISNAKFLPLGWFPIPDSNSNKVYTCDATITITADNKITVSSKVSGSNSSNNYAEFSCSGTLPSSANHLGSIVLNGDLYSTGITIERHLTNDAKLNTLG